MFQQWTIGGLQRGGADGGGQCGGLKRRELMAVT
jgi:hypothetical protein